MNVVFRPEPEGGFTVLVPALPGCITYGKDLGEARHMAREAIELYLESMAADGELMADDLGSPYFSTLEVRVPTTTNGDA